MASGEQEEETAEGVGDSLGPAGGGEE